MDKAKPWALCGLVFGPLFLLSDIKTTFVFERPGHAAAILLAAIGGALILCARLLTRHLGSSSANQAYKAIPLDDIDVARRSPSPSPTEPVAPVTPPLPYGISQLLLAFIALIVAISLRVTAFRHISLHPECAGSSYAVFLPLLFALLDYWLVQRHKVFSAASDDIDDSVYDVVQQYWARSRLRYVLATALLCSCSTLMFRADPTPVSTYICPAVTNLRHSVFVARLATLPLDFCIILCIDYISQTSTSSRKNSASRSLEVVGYASMAAALATLVVGVLYFLFSPDDRAWMLSMPAGFYSSIAKLAIISCITACSTCLSIYYYSAMIPTTIVVFTVTIAWSITSSWGHVQPFPPQSAGLAFFLFTCIIIAFISLVITQAMEQAQSSRSRFLFTHISGWLIGSLVIIYTLRMVTWLAHTSYANFHPADMLIFEAKLRHEKYAARAASSTSLPAAVEQYKSLYGRHPPPGFEKWYEYATTRNSTIIDDFDQIHNDLLPFWAVSPAEIRQRTWQAISNPWNDVAGISIRNGKVDISPNVMPTHRWMLDGIIEMVGHFSESLPDMDLGFNVNDECRVAVPYEVIEGMRKTGKQDIELAQQPVRNSFSEGRAENWQTIPEEAIQERAFREMSFQRTFFDFGNVGCPPGSAARKSRYWDSAHLCTSCAAPHSLGAFLANWTTSADICHQPDMANLHGLYLSPAAFKASHELMPIFSQSKASGYNDILYPSAWNYMDKVKYEPNEDHPDPIFEKKKKTLFWRGSTSEGVSPGSGTWKGMSRQRFNHLVNSINDTTGPQPILLPYPFAPSREKLGYTSVSTSTLNKLVSTDVHIVDTIVRCGGKDCVEQGQEFAPLAVPTDFQSHWSYKYLLDLDGAGFSGRFLPFLSSGSLPFKAALFREWYDSRLTPWLHFVPLDLRGHGFWATLVYFAGLEGRVNGKQVSVVAHDREAELIAEQGREWAGQVLRKEDMEIYFYRLLLEWGRLTDDQRDELGYVVPEQV